MVDLSLRDLMRDAYALLEANENVGDKHDAADWYKLFNGMSDMIRKYPGSENKKMHRYAEIMAVAVYRLLDCKYDGLSVTDELGKLEDNIGKRLDYCIKHKNGG